MGSLGRAIAREETKMNRRHILGLSVLTAFGLALLLGNAPAQQGSLKEQLVGTWTVVSVDNMLPNGTKRQLFGVNPNGILIFDSGGRFAQIQMRSERSNFTSSNRLEASAEEGKAAMMDTLAQFGTWSVSETARVIFLRVERAL